jgi:feruloyl esterase
MKMEPDKLDEFYWYFTILGMGNCQGGDGAWEIGHRTLALASLVLDANVVMAIVQYVEEGIVPETILGIKFVNDDPAEGINLQRRHCRYR